ncbi:hypothetical protein P378_07850 [Desulforamulus profundi]|uniref:Uncharacterized protein n=1 Tax=Desulforamulus profundi TaxID=1383067 RepID=A0A2C6MGZ8_9FIRM|nr:hypothetical protein P378_07850 [Desulforamulus profundi]
MPKQSTPVIFLKVNKAIVRVLQNSPFFVIE